MNKEVEIKERIFNVLKVGSLEMLEFLKLLEIRVTKTEIETAGISCTTRPILLINEDFTDTFCKTDEHLFMLIMHEIYHVILGHTRLFKKQTLIDNIAFDAIINAMLCKEFNEEEYVSFFKEINGDKEFPSCILRPKGENTPDKYHSLLKLLYETDTSTYYDVYETLKKKIIESGIIDPSGKYVLIGNHGDELDGVNPVFKEFSNDIISKWPNSLVATCISEGKKAHHGYAIFSEISIPNLHKMNKLLLKAGITKGEREKQVLRSKYEYRDAITFIPNYKDRTVFAKNMLGQNQLLYKVEAMDAIPSTNQNFQTLVYFDVSRSVIKEIGKVLPLLKKPVKNKVCKLFQFSTEVYPATLDLFETGEYKTTDGTSINSVFKHYFELPRRTRPKSILILTDGDFEKVEKEYEEQILKENIKVYFGLFGRYTKIQIQHIAKYIEEFK